MTSYPCPACHAPADLTGGCPGCGRGPDPDAAEVIRLDAQLPALLARLHQARAAVGAAEAALSDAQRRRSAAAARVRAALATTTRPVPASAPAGRPPTAPGDLRGHRIGAEATTRTVQNLLFLLGGLLLGTAAIVFTAVAWASYGTGVRAALLAAFTAVALAGPLLALRRGLTATAETFAAVGLLLLLLDGYAAWYVDLFGVSGLSPTRYAGAVTALTAGVALGYGARTGLAGPRFAALLVAQPVLPLVLAPGGDLLAWSVALLLVVVVDLAVLRWRRAASGALEVALRAVAWAAGGLVWLAGCLTVLVELSAGSGAGRVAAAGAGLVAAALLAVAAAWLAGFAGARWAAGAGLVVAVAAAAARFCDEVGGPLTPVLIAAVLAVLAGTVAVVVRSLPAPVRGGPWAGALTVLAVAGLPAVANAIAAAVGSLDAARPVFDADLAVRVTGPGDWRVPVTVALLAAGSAVLLSGVGRALVGIGGTVLVVFGVPAALSLPWWAVPALDLAAVAALAAVAVHAARERLAFVAAGAAGVLAGHAVLTGLGRLGVTAAVAGTLTVIALTAAAAAYRAGGHRRIVGGAALVVGLLAWPAALAATLAGLRVEPWWVLRATVAAVLVLVAVLALVVGRWPGYGRYALTAVLAGAAPLPGWAVRTTGAEPVGVYAALALLLIAAAVTLLPLPVGPATPDAAAPRVPVAWAGALLAAVVPAGWFGTDQAATLWAVLGAPYGWLERAFAGRPAGVGLGPASVNLPDPTDAVALWLLAVAVAVPVLARSGRWAAVRWLTPVAVPAVVVTAAAGAVPWPATPAVSLLTGLGALVLAARWRTDRSALATAVAGGLAAGAGLAGALPTRGVTLAALGLVLAAASVVGSVGRRAPVRSAGWLTAVAAGVAVALVAGSAAGLATHRTAFAVLAVAAAALLLGVVLTGRRPVEALAIQAAAQATAVTAVLLALPVAGYAAAVCTLWGLALGLQALWPGTGPRRRRGLAVAAAGTELVAWWLLLVAGEVAVVEAYTVPAAGVALLAGVLTLRGRPTLSSWVGFGPALAAAFLPTLASVLFADGQPVRRLLLGTAAVAVVLAGAAGRRQAPVVVGGGVLALVALPELVLFWDLLPRWIPLALGGLVLVTLAMTLERRRRDLARVRAAVTRMS